MREYSDIETYRKKLIGKTITNVEILTVCDEGLAIALDGESVFCFGFSGSEGFIKFIGPAPKTQERMVIPSWLCRASFVGTSGWLEIFSFFLKKHAFFP